MTANVAVTVRHTTREQWLTEAVEQIGEVLQDMTGAAMPPFRVSVGWPGGRSAGKGNAVIGQCWHRSASVDDHTHIFISPVLDDAPRVLDVLAHEMIHALDGNESGHRGRFAQWAKAFGLAGPMTATVASPDLADALAALVRWRLGAYPHGALADGRRGSAPLPIPVPGAPGGGASSHPKQTTRMLKASCGCDVSDPYIVRITKKQAERGMPKCGLCDSTMHLA